MHARRYFVNALEANDARAAVPIAAFKTLYDVEADLKNVSVGDRRVARAERDPCGWDSRDRLRRDTWITVTSHCW
jgi:hypothetical protein